MLADLRYMYKDMTPSFRLEWQKRVMLAASLLESGLTRAQQQRPDQAVRNDSYVDAYRSRIDGQWQYYFVHLPPNYTGRSALPTVLYVPHNTTGHWFVQQPNAFDDMRKLTHLADEFGYVLLWPHSRGLTDAPLAASDMFEALSAAQARYNIDPNRVFAFGDCRGGGNALSLVEGHPDVFAAIGTLNIAMHLAEETSDPGIANPESLLGNLANVPIRLVHGTYYPHSPTRNSLELREACEREGIKPELLLLPGSGLWADRDPFRIIFEFYRDKERLIEPTVVRYATRQLKYDSAYWVRIKSLSNANEVGSVRARMISAERIAMETNGVSETELLLRRFPGPRISAGTMQVLVNGSEHTLRIDGDSPILVQIEPQTTARGDTSPKTHAVEGPISHVFAEPFVLVQGTGGSNQRRKGERQAANEIIAAWEDHQQTPFRHTRDCDLTAADIQNMNLVLIGTAETNTILSRILSRIPLKISKGKIGVGGAEYRGTNLTIVGVYPNPLNPRKYVLIVTSTNPARYNVGKPYLAAEGRQDVQVWDGDNSGQAVLLTVGYWDNTWKHLLQ